MTDDEIRIAVAESVAFDMWVIQKRGLYYRPNANGYTSSLAEAWKLPFAEVKKHEAYVDRNDVPHSEKVFIKPAPYPDYPNDLNAMHEVEKTLSGCVRVKYLNSLTALSNPAFATARQRCEAYLRTIGKWID